MVEEGFVKIMIEMDWKSIRFTYKYRQYGYMI